MSKYLSIEEQEKVLLTLWNVNNSEQSSFITALQEGCTLTATVAAVVISSKNYQTVGSLVKYAKNFTKEAVMLLLAAEDTTKPYWQSCLNVGLSFTPPNPKLAFELHREETLNYLADRDKWDILLSLLESYRWQSNKESYYTIYEFLRMNAPIEEKRKHNWRVFK